MGRDDLVERIKGELEFACAGGDPADIAQSGYRESFSSHCSSRHIQIAYSKVRGP